MPPPYREAPNPGRDRGYPAGRHVGRAAPGPAVKSRCRLCRRHFPAGLSQGRTHGRRRWREGRDPGRAAPVCQRVLVVLGFFPPSPVNFILFLLLLLFLFSWDTPGWSECSFMPTRAMPGSAPGPLPCKYLCGRSGPGGGPGAGCSCGAPRLPLHGEACLRVISFFKKKAAALVDVGHRGCPRSGPLPRASGTPLPPDLGAPRAAALPAASPPARPRDALQEWGSKKKLKKDGKGSTLGEKKKKKKLFFWCWFFFPTFWKCPGGRRGAGKVPAGQLPAARRLFVAVARPLLSARRRGFPRGTN